MKELYVFCEGATEQAFCKQLLERHLFPRHDGFIRPIAIEHSKHHGRVTRGGVPGRYATMRRDISNQWKARRQRDVLFTTQIDLYGLPKDFPGKKTHRRNLDEHIDDGPATAPSKRIIDLIPAYDGRKPTVGPRIAADIGLPAIRAKCRHFNDWLTRLESLLGS